MKSIKQVTLLLAGLLLLQLSTHTHASGVYTDLGLFTTGNFTVDTDGSMYVPTQSSSGLNSNLTVAAGDTFYGDFTSAPFNWSSYSSFSLLMSSTSSVSVPFTVYFVNAATESSATYTGTTAGLTSTPSSNVLTYVSGASALSNITGFVLTWDGGGAVNNTLVGVQGIPEPSTGAMMILGGVGLMALRRLRKV